jgi:hypothetical protein
MALIPQLNRSQDVWLFSLESKEKLNQLTKRSYGSASLNMIKVGKASILYLSAMLGYFSVSIFTT